ncbi:MAG: hypothetical protein MK226_12090, partial [Saprospiraceae bacterium]|nr:hypothetical protein [Saprospiraceae bacterium]
IFFIYNLISYDSKNAKNDFISQSIDNTQEWFTSAKKSCSILLSLVAWNFCTDHPVTMLVLFL